MDRTMHWNIMFVMLLLNVLSYVVCDMRYSHGGARNRFERKFNQTCSKYAFVDQYAKMLENPSDTYLIFVYHEAGQSNGGLGDRLAGMITALAYALRTNRTFLIVGDSSFEESFQPYHNSLNHKYSWKNWDWANWSREFAANMTKLHCVNPRHSSKHCALDYDNNQQFKVIKYYGNRSYLCRWLLKKSLGLTADILRHLQIAENTDLYEVAGCLLRLAIWPTEKLWNALDISLEPQFHHRQSAQTSLQVGFHFRCGDSSFSEDPAARPNPQCFFDPSVQWKGTNFLDDSSIDSPVDEALCGKQLLSSRVAENNKQHVETAVLQNQQIMAYIASDNPRSSSQINSTLGWEFTIRPPQGCHVDLQKSAHCTLTTSLHWFMLSLSDHIVMQALIKPAVSMFDNSPETAHLAAFEQPAPVSAFSRYAAVYSLGSDSIRYGRDCVSVNRTALSQQTHGNWVCDPKTFY